MKGTIIGDIVGSIYEWHNIKTKDFPLFAPNCFFTDDSIMTLAVGRAFLNCTDEADFPEELVYQMRLFGHMYPHGGYGGRFKQWLRAEEPQPYNSFGNGPRRYDRLLAGGGGGLGSAHRRGDPQPPGGHQGGPCNSGSGLLGTRGQEHGRASRLRGGGL